MPKQFLKTIRSYNYKLNLPFEYEIQDGDVMRTRSGLTISTTSASKGTSPPFSSSAHHSRKQEEEEFAKKRVRKQIPKSDHNLSIVTRYQLQKRNNLLSLLDAAENSISDQSGAKMKKVQIKINKPVESRKSKNYKIRVVRGGKRYPSLSSAELISIPTVFRDHGYANDPGKEPSSTKFVEIKVKPKTGEKLKFHNVNPKIKNTNRLKIKHNSSEMSFKSTINENQIPSSKSIKTLKEDSDVQLNNSSSKVYCYNTNVKILSNPISNKISQNDLIQSEPRTENSYKNENASFSSDRIRFNSEHKNSPIILKQLTQPSTDISSVTSSSLNLKKIETTLPKHLANNKSSSGYVVKPNTSVNHFDTFVMDDSDRRNSKTQGERDIQLETLLLSAHVTVVTSCGAPGHRCRLCGEDFDQWDLFNAHVNAEHFVSKPLRRTTSAKQRTRPRRSEQRRMISTTERSSQTSLRRQLSTKVQQHQPQHQKQRQQHHQQQNQQQQHQQQQQQQTRQSSSWHQPETHLEQQSNQWKDRTKVLNPASPHLEQKQQSKQELQLHLALPRRSRSRSRHCPLCNKRFGRPWLLKCHLRTHTGERPFRCNEPDCARAFADRSNFRAHRRTHQRVLASVPVKDPVSLDSLVNVESVSLVSNYERCAEDFNAKACGRND